MRFEDHSPYTLHAAIEAVNPPTKTVCAQAEMLTSNPSLHGSLMTDWITLRIG